MSSYDDPFTKRDWDDREWEEGTGREEHSDPAVIYVVMPISSGSSVEAKTTFLCKILNIVNEESEGTDMVTEDTGLRILATNITANRPAVDRDVLPAFKIGDRFIISKY
jgi:hypothetical protein